MISLAIGLKSYLIYFCSELEVVLVWNVWKKIQFFRPDFVDFEIAIWGFDFLFDGFL